jgi:hypothetical protein
MSLKRVAYILGLLGLGMLLAIQVSALTSAQSPDQTSQPDAQIAPDSPFVPGAVTVPDRASHTTNADIFYKMAPPSAPLVSAHAGSIPNKPKH